MGALERLVVFVALVSVAGCAPRYVPVHHYQDKERVKVLRDSICYTDTVHIAERGDTVRIEVTKWRTRYKIDTDTLIRVDTIQLPPQIITTSEEPKPSKLLWGFAIVGVLALLYGLFRLIRGHIG